MAQIKLILRADVDNLGRLGEIVTVKAGYGRNYLLPQGLAKQATKANLKQFELERKKLEAKRDALRAEAQEIADKLAQAPLVLEVRVGEGDKLYGSVTSMSLAEALLEQGIELDRKKIEMPEPIKALGEYTLTVRLHPDVQGELNVSVIKHGQTAEEAEAEAEKAEAEAEAADVEAEAAVEAEAVAENESEPEQPATEE